MIAKAIFAFFALFAMLCLGCPPSWARPAKRAPVPAWGAKGTPVCGHQACHWPRTP